MKTYLSLPIYIAQNKAEKGATFQTYYASKAQRFCHSFVTVDCFLSVLGGTPCSELLLYKHVCNMSARASQTYKYVVPLPAFKSKKL